MRIFYILLLVTVLPWQGTKTSEQRRRNCGICTPRGLLVVANSGENSLALVKFADRQVIHKIATEKHPQDVVVSPDGSLAYVAEMGTPEAPGSTVAVVNLRTHRIVRRFDLGGATLPHLLVVSRDGGTLWTACAPENVIVELDTRRTTVKRRWNTQQKGSYLMTVTPDQEKIYVANFDSGSVSVIRRYDGSVKILSLGGQPIGIDTSPDGSEVWVSNFQSNSIAVIDTSSDRIVQTFPSGGDGPARLKFTADGKDVWVTQSRSNGLVVFNAADRRIVQSIAIGKFSKGLLILADGEHGFVSAMDDGQVIEVDVTAGKIPRRIATGAGPEGLAWVGRDR